MLSRPGELGWYNASIGILDYVNEKLCLQRSSFFLILELFSWNTRQLRHSAHCSITSLAATRGEFISTWFPRWQHRYVKWSNSIILRAYTVMCTGMLYYKYSTLLLFLAVSVVKQDDTARHRGWNWSFRTSCRTETALFWRSAILALSRNVLT